jgi:hypothetical protein
VQVDGSDPENSNLSPAAMPAPTPTPTPADVRF